MAQSILIKLRCTLAVFAVSAVGGWALVTTPARRAHAYLEQEIAAAKRIGMPLSAADLPVNQVDPTKSPQPVYYRLNAMLHDIRTKLDSKIPTDDFFASPDPNGLNRWTLNVHYRDRIVLAMKPVYDLLSELDASSAFGTRSETPGWQDRFVGDYEPLETAIVDKADQEDRIGEPAAALRFMRYAQRIAENAGAMPCFRGMSSEAGRKLTVLCEYSDMIGRHARDRAFLQAVERQSEPCTVMPDIRRHFGEELVKDLEALPTMDGLPGNGSEGLPDGYVVRTGPAGEGANSRGFAARLGMADFQSSTVQDQLAANLIRDFAAAWVKFPHSADDWQGFQRRIGDVEKADPATGGALNGWAFRNGYSSEFETVGKMQVQARLLQVSIKLLLSRLDTGSLPEKLPGSLGSIGIDPFNGRPLNYRRKGDGFVLFSVGPDPETVGPGSGETIETIEDDGVVDSPAAIYPRLG